MWCDDFDMDLPKVIPEAMTIVRAIPDRVCLRTHCNHTTDGKLNSPVAWNHDSGMVTFWTLDGGPATGVPMLGSIAPAPYWTDAPIIECTFEEAVRDLWVHNLLMIVDGVEVWNSGPLWRTCFEPLMYHVRGWTTLPEARVERIKRDVCISLRVAVHQLQSVLAQKGIA